MAIKKYSVKQQVVFDTGAVATASFQMTANEADMTAFIALLPGDVTVMEENVTLSKTGTTETAVNKVSKITLVNVAEEQVSTIKPFKGNIMLDSTKGSADIRLALKDKPFKKVGEVEYDADKVYVLDAPDA